MSGSGDNPSSRADESDHSGTLPPESMNPFSQDSQPPIPPPPPQSQAWYYGGPIVGSKEVSRSGGWRGRQGAGIPDPLPLRKAAIGIILALTIWSFYVVVGRVCTPMIKGDSTSGLGSSTGIGTMIAFIILWFMFVWSYLKMILTGPGFARDVVPKSAPPTYTVDNSFIPYNQPLMNIQDTRPLNSGSQSQPDPLISTRVSDNSSPPPQFYTTSSNTDDAGPDPSELAPITNLAMDTLRQVTSNQQSSSDTLNHGNLTHQAPPEHPISNADGSRGEDVRDWRDLARPIPAVSYGPRWCRYCEINKPERTHHCRHCGTCVLAFDHHCIWIGECVGHHNHKFFINFTFWAALFCLYIMIFLIIVESKSNNIDGEVIGLIAVSALFTLFTITMLPSHIHLILTGRTTVESFAARDQYEAEAALLQKEYGFLWHNQAKRKVQRKWKEEYGGIGVGERWKFGSLGDRWKEEMGKEWWGWILPIGRPLGDGIHFKSNPHFGPNGEWLKKKDWPKSVA